MEELTDTEKGRKGLTYISLIFNKSIKNKTTGLKMEKSNNIIKNKLGGIIT